MPRLVCRSAIAGGEIGGARQLAGGVGEPPCGEVSDAQRRVGLGVAGGELDGALQLGEGFVAAAEDEQSATQLEVRGGIAVVELDGARPALARRRGAPDRAAPRCSRWARSPWRRGPARGRRWGPDPCERGRRPAIRLLGSTEVASGERGVSPLRGPCRTACRHRAPASAGGSGARRDPAGVGASSGTPEPALALGCAGRVAGLTGGGATAGTDGGGAGAVTSAGACEVRDGASAAGVAPQPSRPTATRPPTRPPTRQSAESPHGLQTL